MFVAEGRVIAAERNEYRVGFYWMQIVEIGHFAGRNQKHCERILVLFLSCVCGASGQRSGHWHKRLLQVHGIARHRHSEQRDEHRGIRIFRRFFEQHNLRAKCGDLQLQSV